MGLCTRPRPFYVSIGQSGPVDDLGTLDLASVVPQIPVRLTFSFRAVTQRPLILRPYPMCLDFGLFALCLSHSVKPTAGLDTEQMRVTERRLMAPLGGLTRLCHSAVLHSVHCTRGNGIVATRLCPCL